ncbi:MAG: nitrous oxide reductase accessory protein NosL [Proteobacteria bacterium]|nr:nitrous oxide reductase accessory protein NosL [Pseudomonadota bacterium]
MFNSCKKIICFLLIFYAPFSHAFEFKPQKVDKCPVCGMFVYKYKDFLALIVLKEGQNLWFDGAKDFFKFYLKPSKYKKDIEKKHFERLFVTDYYTLRLIDAKKAYYVIGSDIYGPMGKELIPFENYDDAKEFMKDHKAKRILKFDEIDDSKIIELN